MDNSSKKPKIAFATLGCRLNQFETDSLVGRFVDEGYQIVPFEEQADIYVINTCTITGKGEQKSRNMVNRARKKAPSAIVVVTGCSVENNPEYFHLLDDVSLVIDNANKHSIFTRVHSLLQHKEVQPELLGKNLFNFPGSKNSLHTRCAIKIQDGCNNFCTYCIVPHVRGRAISRPYPDIEEAFAEALENGYKEIVLTGVNISKYSYNDITFTSLISNLLKHPGDFRIRISSLEPDSFTEEFAALFDHPKLCNHLHLCLQSGSDNILKKMNRHYSVSDFMKIVTSLRAKNPIFNITTDIIVGFPGESDVDFEDSCRVAQEAVFSHIHTFKFSERSGTRAVSMSDKIPEKIKQERSQIIRNIAELNKKQYRQSLLGTKQRLLVEKTVGNTAIGYGELYVPIQVNAKLEVNHFYDVQIESITSSTENRLLAKLL